MQIGVHESVLQQHLQIQVFAASDDEVCHIQLRATVGLGLPLLSDNIGHGLHALSRNE